MHLATRRRGAQAEGRRASVSVGGRPLWGAGTAAGLAVEIDEAMLNILANSLSIAFGDFRHAYTVI
jgi:HK97 family phage major capsid protein